MKIKKSVYQSLVYDTPKAPPETGGIIGGTTDKITCFEFITGKCSNESAFYSPDTEEMSRFIFNWNKNGISFYGIFHSHPACCPLLTNEDKHYATKIMNVNSKILNFLYFPIVLSQEKVIFFKALSTDGRINFVVENIQIF